MNKYAGYTYNSESLLKRLFHKRRFMDAINVIGVKDNDVFLDYGCGDGHLLKLLSEKVPKSMLIGFEPSKSMYNYALENVGDRIEIVDSVGKLKNSFSKVACLETCEHLQPRELDVLFENLQKITCSKSEIFISVPIETGLSSLFKNMFRLIKDTNQENLSIKNIVRALFGLNVERNNSQTIDGLNYIYSHIGFSHKKFENRLEVDFKIKKKVYSPFPALGSQLNNSIYYICENK